MEMLKDENIRELVKWYRENKRSFPWRDTNDPFDTWISEIMLQQTRVEVVVDYFIRFRNEIKSIDDLAKIDDTRLMRLWEGLGYYSRARNLKKAAIVLCEEYDSKIPCDHEVLLKLPGIGPYTAGAIMAIGYGLPYPAVDGNVLRVLSRLLGIREDIRLDSVRKQLEEVISSYYEENEIKDPSYIRDLSQALMDLGATICLPKGNVRCVDCPLKEECYAYKKGLIEEIPYRSKDKARKIVERTLFIIRDGESFLLARRKMNGLLAGMYEFEGADEKLKKKDVAVLMKKRGYDPLKIRKLPSSKHIFSHLEWHMDAYEVLIGDWTVPLAENEVLVDREGLQKLALPSAFRTYIDYYALRGE